MQKRKVLCVGASVASIGGSRPHSCRHADTENNYFLFFCSYPTLCVWGKHSAWQSTAEIGGGCHRTVAAYKPRPFGQKPEPTLFCKELFTKGMVIYWEERKPKQLQFG